MESVTKKKLGFLNAFSHHIIYPLLAAVEEMTFLFSAQNTERIDSLLSH